MTAADRHRRRQLLDANYGRDFGWFVEKDGRRLAALTDARFEDMFWDSYAVEPLAGTESERETVFTAAFWLQPELVFRNRVTSDVAHNAFQGGPAPTRERPRVWMRSLYISLDESALARFLARRRWRKRQRRGG